MWRENFWHLLMIMIAVLIATAFALLIAILIAETLFLLAEVWGLN